jgi:putative two-component system response regulator
VHIKTLLCEMSAQGVYADEMKDIDIEMAASSARLHDIGKIAIPDSILNKPDKLTDVEYDIMKTHSLEGAQIIDKAIARTGNKEFLLYAKVIAISHHERWDGGGYPNGTKKTEIPLLGRVMAIVDVYDALVSERPYKKALSHEKAIEIIKEGAGFHFDPLIVEIFVSINST